MAASSTSPPRPTAPALARAAREALACFGMSPKSQIKRLNDGENTTWRVRPPGRRRSLVLRLHRAGYHRRSRIEGELAWLEALGRDTPGLAPRAQRSRDGAQVHSVSVPGTEVQRDATLLSWTTGRFTTWPGTPRALEQMGVLAAKLHRQARAWRGSSHVDRPVLRFDDHVGATCHWHVAPLAVPGLRATQRAFLAGIIEDMRARIEAWDTRSKRGLVHADLHFGNVLFDAGAARAIDFDDCARTWFLLDPAVALLSASFQDGYAARRDAFWSGYGSQDGTIPTRDFELLASFQLLRLITMFAWSWTRRAHPQIRASHPRRQRLMLAACRTWNKSDGEALWG